VSSAAQPDPSRERCNNTAKLVKDWTGSDEDLAVKVDEYDSAYTMELREAGEARTPSDPITTEAKLLAKLAIKGALEKAGQKADAKAINAAVDGLLAHPEKGPWRAEERLAERKRLRAAMASIDPPASAPHRPQAGEANGSAA
jgi:hypothetical protein